MGTETERSSAIITGDVVVDHHIYKGQRQVTSSKMKTGTIINSTLGGSRLIYEILKKTKVDVQYGLKINRL